ncbi:MAG TPA: polysaccharide ABC transporter ATP-binding protein [Dehalococcoidia bacterium]|nr:polysaccharide ABC transporter ATP-binding protein [Dehalococcoidia bacterium]
MSSSDLAVSIRGISKAFQIAPNGQAATTLREAIVQKARHPFQRTATDTFWALKDVSLDIHAGEVVGLIGRNGAGKSTLLKVLSRITRPTAGRVRLYGRVGSLLEAGAGFHSELTGRENVYMNGVILGMKRREIDRKFDAIVEFAGIGPFLDVPVKRYSSGMYVRLAFAVAAHLQPEILLVDEVLAVGDADFQKKCLGTMHDVAESGRTVVFVSHNMGAVASLCRRAVVLQRGRHIFDGPAGEAVDYYLRSGQVATASREWPDLADAPGDDVVRLRAVRLRTVDGDAGMSIDVRDAVGVELAYDVLCAGTVLAPGIQLYNDSGTLVFVAYDQGEPWRRGPRAPGRYTSTVWIPGNFLSDCGYALSACVVTMSPGEPIVHCNEDNAVAFRIVESLDGTTARGDYGGRMPGVVRPLLTWNTDWTPATSAAARVAAAQTV